MPTRGSKTKHSLQEVMRRESDEEGQASSDAESILSVDSLAEANFLEGKDPNFELESPASDSDWEPQAQRPRMTRGSSDDSGRVTEEEQQPVASAQFSPPASTRRRPAGRGKGRAGRGRSRVREQPPATSAEEGWQGTDVADVMPKQPIFRPHRAPGPQVLHGVRYTVLQLFQMFLTNSILQTIVNNTNIFGEEHHGTKWQPIIIQDMYSYLSILIYMGLTKVPAMTDYWRRSKLYNLQFPSNVISGRKFKLISTSIHMSDPRDDAANNTKKGTADYDPLFKIKPMYEDIRLVCKANYHPQQNIAIDERMVASKARIGLKQYMENKPVKWGYKLFVLADSSNGYTWDFFVYEGRNRFRTGKGLSYDSVMQLVSTRVLGTGYKLFVDNFYTSPTLFHDLLEKKIWACGTIRTNQIGFSKNLPGRLKEQAPRGTMCWIRDGPLVFVQWRDTRDVTMCSTLHKAHGEETVQRRVRGQDGQWTMTDIPVPPAIKDYNRNMGGVDLSDALIGYYTILHKTKKWYRSLFYHFVDICIVNAFILSKEIAIAAGEKAMTQKAFRETLVEELAAAGSPSTAPPLAAPPAPPGTSHMPQYFATDGTTGRRRCALCHLKTPIGCSTCDVSLCLMASRDCYNDWHSQQNM